MKIAMSIGSARVFKWMWAALGSIAALAGPSEYFAIKVIDADTGRGVPLVELRTVNKVSHWTDSNGLVAFLEPGLMDREVFFHVRSDGYDYPKDGFGNRGVKLKVRAGGHAEIKVRRTNIAERLYRITGGGIYRDSILLGERVPTQVPLLNGEVMGQDTVIATTYKGKIYWFWGDTDRASFPLGNFGASGAISELPGKGGLKPDVGVDLTYFVDQNGFSKPMCPGFGPGLQWIESLMTLKDGQGQERLMARVASMPGLAPANAWHFAVFNDKKEIFESVMRWDVHDSHDVAYPFRAMVGTNEYFYLYPNYRVPARFESLTNLAAYEAYTCLGEGELLKADGGRFEWRKGAPRLDGGRVRELIKAGTFKPDEAWKQPHDIETGKPVHLDRGSVAWNDYRQRWVMITAGQAGEVWFSEGDTPVGPWVYARRVLAHDNYNFYNPCQHSFFDQEGGRLIYFEGTYTDSFSGAKAKTPRYDYNQIMYRLSLDDPRLALPAPIYTVQETNGTITWMAREEIQSSGAAGRITSIPFFAMPPARRGEGMIPIYRVIESGIASFQTKLPAGGREHQPLFFALSNKLKQSNDSMIPLDEFGKTGGGTGEPLCFVWRNPMSVMVLDWSSVLIRESR